MKSVRVARNIYQRGGSFQVLITEKGKGTTYYGSYATLDRAIIRRNEIRGGEVIKDLDANKFGYWAVRPATTVRDESDYEAKAKANQAILSKHMYAVKVPTRV